MTDKRVIVITGSSGKIGGQIAKRFGAEGYRTALLYFKNQEAVRQLSTELSADTETLEIQADVRSPDAMAFAAEEVRKKWSRVDTLVSAAGIRRDGLLIRTSERDWDETMAVNLKGVWNTLRAFGEGLMASKNPQAWIIGSAAGFHGRPGQSSYTASKAGLYGLVRSVAREWKSHGIRVNLLLPGFHEGGIAGGMTPGQKNALTADHLLDHPPSIPEVADMVFHLSTLSSISGQTFNLDSRIF